MTKINEKKTPKKRKKNVKRDWHKLEKEFLLGDYKSVSAFLRKKKIENNSHARKNTLGWATKKKQKNDIIVAKTIEKVIEKESTKEANKIVNTKDTATKLLEKINLSIEELNKYFSRNTKKTKTVEYDNDIRKPTKEVVEETEEVSEFFSIIDRSGLKQLTSALKDINDILNNNNDSSNNSTSFADEIEKAWRNRNER